MDAYLAWPDGPGPSPGIIVCSEIFGVTAHMRNIADRFAALGYLALVPNFSWRNRSPVDLAYDATGREEGLRLLRLLDRASVIEDMKSAIAALRSDKRCTGRIGAVGFSSGGHIAFLAATQLDLPATASFYAGWIVNGGIPLSEPEPTITLAPSMAKRGGYFLGLVGGNDHLISAAEWEQFGQALTAAGVRHDLVSYPSAKHGFFCDERDGFDHQASADAWRRVVATFDTELKATGGEVRG